MSGSVPGPAIPDQAKIAVAQKLCAYDDEFDRLSDVGQLVKLDYAGRLLGAAAPALYEAWAAEHEAEVRERVARELPDAIEAAAAEFGWRDEVGQTVVKVWRVHETVRQFFAARLAPGAVTETKEGNE